MLSANWYHVQLLSVCIALKGNRTNKRTNMPTTISSYFADELTDWGQSINYYNRETDELTQKLGELIRRNSIPGIAEKVEMQQDALNRASGHLLNLQVQVQQQLDFLTSDSSFIDDSFISAETENKQAELRKQMQELEKQFIDVKYNCFGFLSGMLKK